jgi:hypothetical protein
MRQLGLVLPVFLSFLHVSGCGSSNENRSVVPEGGAMQSGTGGQASGGRGGATGGALGTGGTGGTGGGSAGGSAGHADGGVKDASATSVDASIDVSTESGRDAAANQEPVVDAGAGCEGPGRESLLSPPSAGLPSSGLVLWLRADRGVYMTSAHRVCAWVDQSGNDQVLRSTTARPLWVDASLGSEPAISFDVANASLSVGGVLGIPATSGRTFVAVVQLVNTTGRFQAVMQGQAATPGTYMNLDTNTFQTAGSREGVYLTNNGYDSSLATSTSPRVHVFTVSTLVPGTPVLGAIDYRVNSATQTLTRTSGGLGNGNIEDFSQANFTLVGNGVNASIAEVLVYDRALTVPERASAEIGLKTRYGIP